MSAPALTPAVREGLQRLLGRDDVRGFSIMKGPPWTLTVFRPSWVTVWPGATLQAALDQAEAALTVRITPEVDP